MDLIHGLIHVQAKPDLGFHIKNYQDRYIPLASEARAGIAAMLAQRKPCKLLIGGKTVNATSSFTARTAGRGETLPNRWSASSIARA